MFPSVQILHGILLCKIQFPIFRVSGAPPWVCRGTPKSRFHVSKCADSRIFLCKFQIIGDKTRFRVSEFPRFQGPSVGPRRDPNFQIPCFLVGRFQDIHSRFQDSECADSWILPGEIQIPSFRVSEAPSWVRAQGTPNFQFPSFRVSEAPSTDVFSQRDTHIPDSEFPSFEASFCRVHTSQCL